jgi:hypothetical protein
MKKLLIFVVMVVVGYLVYDNFIKEKEVVKINASYTKAREAVDIDAPAINPRDFAHYEGTVKNISDKVLNNLVITYLIDAQESVYKINKLEPGEEVNFKTESVMLRHMDPGHYLKNVAYSTE